MAQGSSWLARAGYRQPKTPQTARALLRFDAIGAGGDGVAMFEGRKVYAARTAPGDVVLAEIRGDRASVLEWRERGPERREPECPHYDTCGGCSLQHVTLEAYVAWKRERIASALARAGVEAVVGEPILVDPATRRRAAFAIRRGAGGALLGFNASGSSEVVSIDQCKVLHPKLLGALPTLRQIAAVFVLAAFDVAVTLCENGTDLDVVARKAAEPAGEALSKLIALARQGGVVRVSLNGAPVFTLAAPIVRFDDLPVSPPPGAFLQASKEGEMALLGLVRRGVAGARRIADLFSGCGTFALPLARTAQVEAYDSDRAAVAALIAAAKEAQRNGLALNVKGTVRDLFETSLRAADLNRFDAVVFDPPRAGAKTQAAEIARSRVRLVVGVSCNPDSFARDAAILSQADFTLDEVTPVDQFVYAPHIELVGVFRRR